VLLGTGLPPVYSGHNAYWDWGPPPAGRTVVVHVGDWRPADWRQYFVGCHDVAQIDNGLGIDNSEQGKAISVCTGTRRRGRPSGQRSERSAKGRTRGGSRQTRPTLGGMVARPRAHGGMVARPARGGV
jgi:hypothetical protein